MNESDRYLPIHIPRPEAPPAPKPFAFAEFVAEALGRAATGATRVARLHFSKPTAPSVLNMDRELSEMGAQFQVYLNELGEACPAMDPEVLEEFDALELTADVLQHIQRHAFRSGIEAAGLLIADQARVRDEDDGTPHEIGALSDYV